MDRSKQKKIHMSETNIITSQQNAYELKAFEQNVFNHFYPCTSNYRESIDTRQKTIVFSRPPITLS